ncbi:retinol dehydrogenase 12-like [Galendromus occidentalis]|uniref:Retinol dehydrogenase 12-like n=1 Tax=Galendromus occidentalis TaxID=34638 RepID=A0AAJ6QYC6_9ACAR|nr:retinol dehydrogenase 12-like [Galendromus occidentalis]
MEMSDFLGSVFFFVKLILVPSLPLKLYIMTGQVKCKSRKRMDGKVVLITGANSGIGKVTARDLLQRGATVIFGCRNLKKASAVAQELLQGKSDGRIVMKRVDLSDFHSIHTAAREILAEEERLDVLINNAGTVASDFKLTTDGFEKAYQVNYLAPVLLTELLLPLLKRSAPARVVNVGSVCYIFGSINPKTLAADFKSKFSTELMRYASTKLALLAYTKASNKELGNSGVTVNVLHPGVARTTIVPERTDIFAMLYKIFDRLMQLYGRSAKDAAQTVIHLSVESIAPFDKGQYWAECRAQATWRGNDPFINGRVLKIPEML